MPQSWDMGHIILLPLQERHTEDFPDARKIQRLWPGLNPRTRVPVASMLTTRPPKPSQRVRKPLWNLYNFQLLLKFVILGRVGNCFSLRGECNTLQLSESMLVFCEFHLCF